MVAPNGAHKSKSDHPALPITIAEIVETAKNCHFAGADGIHAHVRDENGQHVLDAGLYAELLKELAQAVPDLAVQITTEAVGLYSPADQRQLVREVKPKAVSIAVKEMIPDDDTKQAASFYHWAHEASIQVQHILYSADELERLTHLVGQSVIPADSLKVLFVLGRYTAEQQSNPTDLDPFLTGWKNASFDSEWGVCAFGSSETACLLYAHQQGGTMRIGFENSLHNEDGSLAKDNAERVTELKSKLVSF